MNSHCQDKTGPAHGLTATCDPKKRGDLLQEGGAQEVRDTAAAPVPVNTSGQSETVDSAQCSADNFTTVTYNEWSEHEHFFSCCWLLRTNTEFYELVLSRKEWPDTRADGTLRPQKMRGEYH
jgi:hypothetical protein